MKTITLGKTAQTIPTQRSTMELTIPRFRNKNKLVHPVGTRTELLNLMTNDLNQGATERDTTTSHVTRSIVSFQALHSYESPMAKLFQVRDSLGRDYSLHSKSTVSRGEVF